ncbi:MAG: histidine--tRNA ligase [Patescibacteria group bacterium]
MPENASKKLSTDTYKGVRDFYPKDMAVQSYIFSTWKKVVEQFGYSEYSASVLEPADLYRAKSGEELINEQTYTFTDRGDREVTLRPEMTPTVARMVASKKRELSFPLRWYSIPNLFRYEQPQRGRLREHWQLNVDLFGVKSLQAEVEVISMAVEILRGFGLTDTQFEVRLNNRKIVNFILNDVLELSADKSHALAKLIDRKAKMSAEDFDKKTEVIVGLKFDLFKTLINSQNFEHFVSALPVPLRAHEGIVETQSVIENLEKLGITNVRFDQTLMRGFDYYTGTIFEVFDTNPDNRRSIFGGGRYDDLLAIFGQEKVPAVGFGAGDVVMKDLLTTYNLLPTTDNQTRLYIAIADESSMGFAQDLAQTLRESGVSVALDYSGKKIGDQIKYADKNKIPFVTVIGASEIASGQFKIKHLETGVEVSTSESEIAQIVNR